METDILIIGAGLSGLVAAYRLDQNNKHIKLVEARGRLGGRIHTKGFDTGQPVELGATWLGSKHVNLAALLSELNIDTYPQKIGDRAIYEAISTSPPYLAKLPPNPDPSLRIKNGSESLIRALAKKIPAENIILNQAITQIHDQGDYLEASGTDFSIKAKNIISTLPPYLFVNTITCYPSLAQTLLDVAGSTHTWMGESIKIVLRYATPFWNSEKSSGTIFSNVGPVPEMYDHSDHQNNNPSLMGFLNGNYYRLSKEERLQLILNQLQKYYGPVVNDIISYEETVWSKEPFTFLPYEKEVLPHQNNGHPAYRAALMDGKLILAGTETSNVFPGYMEGAVHSAFVTADKILDQDVNL